MLDEWTKMIKIHKKTIEIRQRHARRLQTETRMKLNYLDLKEKMKGV